MGRSSARRSWTTRAAWRTARFDRCSTYQERSVIAQARPDSLQEWLDEPRWWMGKPAYGDPRFRVGDLSLPDIIEVLRQVYDEKACRAMIMNGYWAPLAG